jgi:hypothetical protein
MSMLLDDEVAAHHSQLSALSSQLSAVSYQRVAIVDCPLTADRVMRVLSPAVPPLLNLQLTESVTRLEIRAIGGKVKRDSIGETARFAPVSDAEIAG